MDLKTLSDDAIAKEVEELTIALNLFKPYRPETPLTKEQKLYDSKLKARFNSLCYEQELRMIQKLEPEFRTASEEHLREQLKKLAAERASHSWRMHYLWWPRVREINATTMAIDAELLRRKLEPEIKEATDAKLQEDLKKAEDTMKEYADTSPSLAPHTLYPYREAETHKKMIQEEQKRRSATRRKAEEL